MMAYAADSEKVYEKPIMGSIPVADLPTMPDQLSFLRDTMTSVMTESDRLCRFICGHGIPYDKLEDQTLMAHLAFAYRSLQLLAEKLREMNNATGAM